MDKIIQSSKNITPYGGLNFIYQTTNLYGLDKFINDLIGYRSVLAQYSYSDKFYHCLAMHLHTLTHRI